MTDFTSDEYDADLPVCADCGNTGLVNALEEGAEALPCPSGCLPNLLPNPDFDVMAEREFQMSGRWMDPDPDGRMQLWWGAHGPPVQASALARVRRVTVREARVAKAARTRAREAREAHRLDRLARFVRQVEAATHKLRRRVA